MRIREFSIDRFGMLHDQRVTGLSGGITVFLGRNEAGKSTCLNFFRAMLFGYARSRRSIDYLTDSKAVSGGSLVIESEALGLVRLMRRPGVHGGPFSLTGLDGAPRPDGDLAVLLRGCTPDLYDKVFAFSLSELMHFGSLTDDNIRHALHGAAFGMGLRSPGQVLKELEDAMRAIFAPRASSSKMHKLMHALDEVNAFIRDKGNEADRYARLRTELEEAARELETLGTARAAMEADRRTLERKAVLRRRWDALREAGDVLAALPETPGAFTPDGRERLDRLAERLEDRKLAHSAARQALERAEREITSLAYNPDLADAAPALFSLAGRKERVREAASQLLALDAERQALERDAARICADLGPDWDAARVEASDVSLAAHERCATLGRELTGADRNAATARHERDRLERELTAASKALEDVREALEKAGGSGPDEAHAGEAAMERLAQLLMRAADAHEKTGTLALAVRNAEHALTQAVTAIDSAWTRQDLDQTAMAPADRDRLLDLARAATAAQARVLEREREKRGAELLHEDAARRTASLESSVTTLGVRLCGDGTTAAGAAAFLDLRRRVVRRAQTAKRNLEAAQAAYASANEQLGDIATLLRGSRRKSSFPWSLAVLFLAALCLVCGGGVLYLGRSGNDMGMVQAGTGLLAGGGALAVAWLALFLRGGGGPSEDADRNWAAIEQRLVRTRIAAQDARAEAEEILDALVADAPEVFPDGIVDAEILAEAEQLLAEQRERLAVLERETVELERETAALAEARKRLAVAERAWEEARSQEERARQAWADALRGLGLPESARPEDAGPLLERLETALARRSYLAGRIADQEESRARIAECLRFARTVPDLADALASIPEPESHLAPDHGPWLDLVREYLARWRSAGRERIRLRELLAERSLRHAEAAGLLAQAGEALETAEKTAGAAREQWRSWLRSLFLSPDISPDTARLALDAAGKARTCLENIRRLDARIEAVRTEGMSFLAGLAAFAPLAPDHPAASLAASGAASGGASGGVSVTDAAGMSTLLSFLDDLAALARDAGEKAAVRTGRERELPALRDAVTLAAEQAAVTATELEELLRQGVCDSPEGYRLAHAAWEAREEALTAYRTIAAALEREAGEAELGMDELAVSFSAVNRDEEAARLADIEAALAGVIADERAAAERKGGIEAAMGGLLNEKGLTQLLNRRESLLAELREQAGEWSRNAMARELLLAAKGRFESERQTGVVRTAGELFSRVTDGAYSGITVSLDDESVSAVGRDGTIRNAETELSRGTREQLYLALRLAYVLDHGAQAEKLPVIMDDILVNFDAARARKTAEILADFSRNHQVLFFTCHEGMADLLRGVSPETAAFRLKRGAFTPDGGN